MEDKKLNWRDLLKQHLQGTVQNTVAATDTEFHVLVLPEYNPVEELKQLRDFMLEFSNGTMAVASVSHLGFDMPGNETVH